MVNVSNNGSDSITTTLYIRTLKHSHIVNMLVPENRRTSVSYSVGLMGRLGVGGCAIGVNRAFGTLVGTLPDSVPLSSRALAGVTPQVEVATLCTMDRDGGNHIMGAYGLSRS